MFGSLSILTGFLAVAATAMPSSTRPLSSRSAPDPDSIKAVNQSTFPSYQTGGLQRAHVSNSSLTKRCATTPTLTWGDTDTGGLGVEITNADSAYQGFYFYQNSCDDVPYKYIWIAAGATEFVSLPAAFQGRVTRGVDAFNLDGSPQTLATWFEIGIDDQGWLWGDISLIRGCDGAALIWSLDNSGAWKGFTQWILDGAPDGSYDMKNDGQWVLKYTENTDLSINTAPRDWYISQVGADYVYVDDSHGSPVIVSTNGRMASYWPSGRP